MDVSAGNDGVDETEDSTEGLGGGERGIGADLGDGDGKGVEVVLGRDEANGGSQNGLIGTELLDNAVGEGELETCQIPIFFKLNPSSYLVARTSSGEENTGNLAGERGSGTGGAKVTQSVDGRSRNLLLAETGLGNSQEEGKGDSLGVHLDGSDRNVRCDEKKK